MDKRKRNCVDKKNQIKTVIKQGYKCLTIAVAVSSAILLWYWNVNFKWSEGYKGYVTLSIVGLAFGLVYWFFAKMYQAQKIGIYRLIELTYFQVLTFAISDVIFFVECGVWFHGITKRQMISFVVAFILQMVISIIIIFVCNRLFAKFDEPLKIIIVYGKEDYSEFLKKLNAKKYRYKVMGCYEDNVPMERIKETLEDCESLYLYNVNKDVKKELILHCEEENKDIYITREIEEVLTMGFDISHTFDTLFIRTKRVPETWYYSFVKRTLDILTSMVAILIFSPVFLIVSLLIKMYDGGPVLYKQFRLTKNHKKFEIYKFRSMIVDAEKQGARLASQNDARITPIGKVIRATRLDELPQLFNILKGDMTIVGPRPERPEIQNVYLEELPEFNLRLKVKAGLTGYAQVFGKYNTTPADKLKLDLLYINQRSLLLDIKLIFYTIKILFVPESTEGIEDGKKTAGEN